MFSKMGQQQKTGSQIKTGECTVNLDQSHFSNFSSPDELGHAMNNLPSNLKREIRDLIQRKLINREDNHKPITITLQRSSSTRNPPYAFQMALSPTGLHILLCKIAKVNREALVLRRRASKCSYQSTPCFSN